VATAKDKTKDDTLAAAFNAPDYDGAELAVPEQRNRVAEATAETVVGVPEMGDEELVGDFVIWLNAKAEESNADTMSMLAQALRQAEGAESVAEALREAPTASSKDVLDRPFLAHGFTIHEGQFEEGELPFFASIEAEFKELPERVILNTGAFKILAVLRKLEEIGEWPIPLVFVGKQTRKGRTVVSLKYLG
jgi:hypothetical protein